MRNEKILDAKNCSHGGALIVLIPSSVLLAPFESFCEALSTTSSFPFTIPSASFLFLYYETKMPIQAVYVNMAGSPSRFRRASLAWPHHISCKACWHKACLRASGLLVHALCFDTTDRHIYCLTLFISGRSARTQW